MIPFFGLLTKYLLVHVLPFIMQICLLLLLPSISRAVDLGRCANPKNVEAAVKELKETFECSGLTIQECDSYKSGPIGVGIAAATAAGIADLSRDPAVMNCLLPGTHGGGAFIDWKNMVVFGQPVSAAPASGCNLSAKAITEEFEKLATDYETEAKNLEARYQKALRDVGSESRPSSTVKPDAKKVTDRARTNMVSALEELKKRISQRSGANPQTQQWVLEAVDEQVKILKSHPDEGLTTTLNAVYERTLGQLDPSDANDLGRDLRGRLLYGAASKLAQEELLRAGSTLKHGSATEKKAVVEQLKKMEVVKRELELRASSFKRAAMEIRGLRNASPEAMRRIATSRLGYIINSSLDFMVAPSADKSAIGKAIRIGRKTMANLVERGGGKATRVAGGVLMTLGPALAKASPVLDFVELATAGEDPHCGGELHTPFSYKEMIDGRCRSRGVANPATLAFLYLTPEERAEHMKQYPDACDMLAELYQSYTPSSNWTVNCSSGDVELIGKGSATSGQRFRFTLNGQEPRFFEWRSTEEKTCAKVELSGQKVVGINAYKIKPGQSTCGLERSGTQRSFENRTLKGSQKREIVAELQTWMRANSAAITAGIGCCHGKPSEMCPASSVSPLLGSGSGSQQKTD